MAFHCTMPAVLSGFGRQAFVFCLSLKIKPSTQTAVNKIISEFEVCSFVQGLITVKIRDRCDD